MCTKWRYVPGRNGSGDSSEAKGSNDGELGEHFNVERVGRKESG